jgi:cellulose biosynthesis protein BcsQ
MKVFATYNLKGGVGKTAAAVNLAFLSARDGYRTLVWDLDPQGAATFYFRVEAKVKGGGKKLLKGDRELTEVVRGTDYDNLDLLPSDFSYRNLDLTLDAAKKPTKLLARRLLPLSELYDRVFLDCPPSISLVSESVFVAADVLLVPTIPTVLSLRTLDRLARYLEKTDNHRLRVLPFFCLVDRRRALHREILDEAGKGPFPFLEAQIPSSSLVEQMGRFRAPLAAFARSSPPALAFEALWREIEDRTATPKGNHR